MASSRIQSCLCGVFALLGVAAPLAYGQTTAGNSVELALTFSAQRSLQVNTNQNFWAEGGGAEVGVDAFRGLGIAASFSGAHTSNIGSTGTSLSLVTETFGPRYRWHGDHKWSLYGEGLVGEANAYNSLFPSMFGAQTDANALAVQVGGGVDLRLSRHLAVRALQASWLRTQLPNSTSDIQNNLLLGAGIVIRSGH